MVLALADSYDWSAYYREALIKQKKENTKLAGELSDMQAKESMLADKYRRLSSGAFGRAYRASQLPKRAVKKLLRLAKGVPHTGTTLAQDHPLYRDYLQKVRAQKYAYAEWIRNVESAMPQLPPAPENSVVMISYAELAAMDLKKATDAIYLCAEQPDALDPMATGAAWDYLTKHPNRRIWYAQEDHLSASGMRMYPWWKPRWSPETLLSFFYFGSLFAVRGEDLRKIADQMIDIDLQTSDHRKDVDPQKVAGQKEDIDTQAPVRVQIRKKVYEICLRITFADMSAFSVDTIGDGRAEEIAGVTDRVLYHVTDEAHLTGTDPSEEASQVLETTASIDYAQLTDFWGYEADYVGIKQRVLRDLGIETKSYPTAYENVVSIAPIVQDRIVSVIIPSKDHPELLRSCIGSLLEKTAYRSIEIIIVDNGSSEEHQLEIRSLADEFISKYQIKIRYIVEEQPFNFSKMCNRGVREAVGEFILLLNDDTTVCEEDWLSLMVGQASLPGCGAVGAKLWYPKQERIQHAGITNMYIGPSHKLVTFPDDRTYYYGHNTMNYLMAGVTAACLLVRRDLYEMVGEMDEKMAVAYNDVDLCFRLLEAGYRNVQRNDAVVIHHESISRGLDEQTAEKWDRLLREKEHLYKKHPLFYKNDPYYDVNLTGNQPDYEIGYEFPYERTLEVEQVDPQAAGKIRKAGHDTNIMLTVERTGLQNKFHREEPSIYHVEGWCYRLNDDNCRFRRWLLLKSSESGAVSAYPVRDRYRYDVERILPMQTNVGLSGFVCRIAQKDLQPGTYQVGMLYENMENHALSYNYSDRMIIRQ